MTTQQPFKLGANAWMMSSSGFVFRLLYACSQLKKTKGENYGNFDFKNRNRKTAVRR